jgi:hypothetical protein
LKSHDTGNREDALGGQVAEGRDDVLYGQVAGGEEQGKRRSEVERKHSS